MPGQTYPFQAMIGETKDIGPIGFIPSAIALDNPTPVFAHFPGLGFGSWVKPTTLFTVIPAPVRDRSLRISMVDVPYGGTYNAPVIASYTPTTAYGVIFEDPQPLSPGISSGANFFAAFTSLSRPAAAYSFDVPSQGFVLGIVVYITVTGGTGTLTVGIADRDANLNVTSNNYIASTALTNPSTYILQLYPGLTPVANVSTSALIGPTPRINATVVTNPVTFAIDYALIQ